MVTKTKYSARNEDSAEEAMPVVFSPTLRKIRQSFERKVATLGPGGISLKRSGAVYGISTPCINFVVQFIESQNNIEARVYASRNKATSHAFDNELEEERFKRYIDELVATDKVFTEGPLKSMESSVRDARTRINFTDVINLRDEGFKYGLVLRTPKSSLYEVVHSEENKDVIGADFYRLSIGPMLAWFAPALKEKIRQLVK